MIFEHEFLELHELLFSLLTFVLCQQETDDVPENLQNCFPCFVHNFVCFKGEKIGLIIKYNVVLGERRAEVAVASLLLRQRYEKIGRYANISGFSLAS